MEDEKKPPEDSETSKAPNEPEEVEDPTLRKKVQPSKSAPQAPQQGGGGRRSFRFHPFRTIGVLLIIILILLCLMLYYGLGRGGGKTFPGSSNSPGVSGKDVPVETPVQTPRPQENKQRNEKPVVHCRLVVSFQPSEDEPDAAEPLVCMLNWTDPATNLPQEWSIRADNMADFEFALEKAIRAWRVSLVSETVDHLPVLAVEMHPFPGEGIFKKIETLARNVDEKIDILRTVRPSD